MKHYTDSILAYLSDELDPAERAGMEAHLADCQQCALRLKEEQAFWDALETMAPTPSARSVWPAVQARTTGRQKGWFFGTGKLVQSGLAVCTLAAGLLLGVLVPGGGSGGGLALAGDLDESETLWISGTSLEAGESDLEALWFASEVTLDEAAEEGNGS